MGRNNRTWFGYKPSTAYEFFLTSEDGYSLHNLHDSVATALKKNDLTLPHYAKLYVACIEMITLLEIFYNEKLRFYGYYNISDVHKKPFSKGKSLDRKNALKLLKCRKRDLKDCQKMMGALDAKVNELYTKKVVK